VSSLYHKVPLNWDTSDDFKGKAGIRDSRTNIDIHGRGLIF
jgi:hypothetical protein